jgi:hypothetical protein
MLNQKIATKLAKIPKEFKGYGRTTIIDYTSGRVFVREPILPHVNHTGNWGDQNPVTGKLTGNYNGKTRGGVTKENSIISEEWCKNIRTVKGSGRYEME